LKSAIGNYSIAGKRGQWPAPEDTSLPYLTYIRTISPWAGFMVRH